MKDFLYKLRIKQWQEALIDKAKQFHIAEYLVDGPNKAFYKEFLKYQENKEILKGK